MTKRIKIAMLAGSLLLVAVLLFHFFSRDTATTYHGRSLSEWLFCCNGGEKAEFGNPALTREAVEAVQHYGTNAIPLLLNWIQHDAPSPWEMKRDFVLSKMPNWLTGNSRLDVRGMRPNRAVVGFKALGTNAAAAIPELTRMFKSRNGTGQGFQARYALAYLGKDALPPLLEVLQQPPNWNQLSVPRAIAAMGYLGTNAQIAVPVLIQATTNIPSVAREAARALGCLKLEPELSIPALTDRLGSSDSVTRCWAAWSLGEFGALSKPAAPLLLELFHDPLKSTRMNAYMALRKIDPELLTNEWHTVILNGIPHRYYIADPPE